MIKSLTELNQQIISCERCPRLRTYCQKVAKEKRRQFQDEEYWGKPIPGFGDPKAQIYIVGLAPAAHGGNRTGRLFTGDQSGVWLFRALHKAGFANQKESTDLNDGMKLKNIYIGPVVRCAPPANKPNPDEIANCFEYLENEMKLLKRARVVICLGQIALTNFWTHVPDAAKPFKIKPKFTHGGEILLNDGRVVITSFHPSQQNTFTKKLTEPMLDNIFKRAKKILL